MKIIISIVVAIMAISTCTSAYAAQKTPFIETDDCLACYARLVVKVGDKSFTVKGIMENKVFYWLASDLVFRDYQPLILSSGQQPDGTTVTLDQPSMAVLLNPIKGTSVSAYMNDYNREFISGKDDPQNGFEVDGEMIEIESNQLAMMKRGYLPLRKFFELVGFKVNYNKGFITIS